MNDTLAFAAGLFLGAGGVAVLAYAKYMEIREELETSRTHQQQALVELQKARQIVTEADKTVEYLYSAIIDLNKALKKQKPAEAGSRKTLS